MKICKYLVATLLSLLLLMRCKVTLLLQLMSKVTLLLQLVDAAAAGDGER